REVGRMQVAILLVEGGGKVISSFIEGKFADEVFLFLSPRIIGGKDAPTWVEGKGFEFLNETPRLDIKSIRKLSEDILIHGVFKK
ncbi:dihydrofolate reductase family protein, partial [Candidatus Aerophobetes bacterium]|nr:dihydrofolate reductase family protein [Candidatus Aerophobetes bacterium]